MRYGWFWGVLSAAFFWVSCQKETEEQEARVEHVDNTILQSSCDGRDSLVSYVLAGLSSTEFESALYDGLSAMRDGDSEVLLSEIVYPAHTRSAAWQRRAYESFSDALSGEGRRMRGGVSLEGVLGSFVKDDPLMQLLLVAPQGVEMSRELLSDPRLHIAVWPKGMSDNKPFLMRAYNRSGRIVEIPSNKQPDFPVIVIGGNERVGFVENSVGQNMADSETAYHATPQGSYYDLSVLSRKDGLDKRQPITHEEDEGGGGGGGYNKPPAPPRLRKDISNGAEILLKAGFRTHDDLVSVEPWGKGRPEMRCVIRANEKELEQDTRFGDRGWYYAKRKYLNNRLFPWSSLAEPGDFYSVLWIEEDGGCKMTFKISFTYKGFSASWEVLIDDDDDIIGKKVVCYTDPVKDGGTMYDMGIFLFWIDVRRDY